MSRSTKTDSLRIGAPAPDFRLPASGGGLVSLRDFAGRKVVLYFYPADDTPTCTKQACAFRDAMAHFSGTDAVVLGVSTDPVTAHDKFIRKYKLPFTLLADEDHAVCTAYGVWQKKSMFGYKYMGIVRSTFVIDTHGRLAAEFRNIRIKGHIDAVLAAVRAAS